MNRISQYLVYPIVWFFSSLFLNIQFKNPDGLSAIVGKPAIIIANHIAFYDSFLLRLNPYSVGLSLYFMGVKSFNATHMRFLWTTGLIPLVYYIFGVFLVFPGKGLKKNLETPKKLLSDNNQIFIFPEGSVNYTGILKPFKKGAAALAYDTGATVLPIAYKEVRSPGRRRKIIITIGTPMDFSQETSMLSVNNKMQERLSEMLG